MCKGIYIVSTVRKQKRFRCKSKSDLFQWVYPKWWRMCACACTYMNSRCTAYSLDMKGIWSSASLLANIRALSQCRRSLLIWSQASVRKQKQKTTTVLKQRKYYDRGTYLSLSVTLVPPVQRWDSWRTGRGPAPGCNRRETWPGVPLSSSCPRCPAGPKAGGKWSVAASG